MCLGLSTSFEVGVLKVEGGGRVRLELAGNGKLEGVTSLLCGWLEALLRDSSRKAGSDGELVRRCYAELILVECLRAIRGWY